MNFENLVNYIQSQSRFQEKHNLDIEIKILYADESSALVQKISSGERYGVALYFCYNRMIWSNKQDWIFLCFTTQQIKNFIDWFIPAHDQIQIKFNRYTDRILPWLYKWIDQQKLSKERKQLEPLFNRNGDMNFG